MTRPALRAVVTGRWALCDHLPLSCAFFRPAETAKFAPKTASHATSSHLFPSEDTLAKLPRQPSSTQAVHSPQSPRRPQMLAPLSKSHTAPHRRQRLADLSRAMAPSQNAVVQSQGLGAAHRPHSARCSWGGTHSKRPSGAGSLQRYSLLRFPGG